MGTSAWRVDSLHVNVGRGDCAIHLLVDTEIIDGKALLCAAVLVDSGQNREDRQSDGPDDTSNEPNVPSVSVADRISQKIEWINKNYRFESGKTLQFDSIVISHWDADHYRGLFQLLDKDIGAAKEKNQTTLPYLKYDAQEKPMTYFYAPIFKGKSDKKGAPILTSIQGTFKQDDKDVRETFVKYKKFLISRLRTTDALKSKDQTKSDLYNVLGVNFFTNIGIEKTHQDKSHKPSELVKQNPPKIDGQPGFYCIGVMAKALPTKSGAIEAKPPMRTVVDTTQVIEDVNKSETNQISIAGVILWSKSTRISYWMAGDTPDFASIRKQGTKEYIESLYVAWTQSEKPQSVTTVKLSHHGSSYSTPTNMLDKLCPINTMVFNPSGGDYHPGWENILAWSLYYRTKSPSLGRPIGLFATKIPWYLVKGSDGKFSGLERITKDKKDHGLNVNSFLDPNREANKNFTDYVAACYKTLNSNEKTPAKSQSDLTAFREEVGNKPRQDQRQYIAAQTLEKWNLHGFPSEKTHPAASTAYVLPSMMPASVSDQLDMVIVVSTDDPNTDGKVQFKPKGLDNIYDLPTTKQIEEAKKSSYLPVQADANSAGIETPYLKRRKLDVIPVRPGVISDTFFSEPEDDPDEADPDTEPEDEGADVSILATISPPLVESQATRVRATNLATEPKFCIYGSVVSSPPDPVKHISVTLKIESISDSFVSSLNCCVITLTADPRTFFGLSPITLADTDEWGCWMSDAINATDVSAFVSVDAEVNIGGYALAIDIEGAEPDGDPAATLLFSTREIANAFEVDVEPDSPLSVGYADEGLLLLALDAGQSSGTLTLGNLLAYIKLLNQFDGGFPDVLRGMQLHIPTSDTANGRRNAVWFDSYQAYTTTVRLQFDLAESARSTLNSWLSYLSNIEVVSAYAVARRISIWSTDANAVQVISKGSLALVASICIPIQVDGQESKIDFEGVIQFEGTSTTVQLTLNTCPTAALRGIINWLKSLAGIENFWDFTDVQKRSAANTTCGEFALRRVTISLGLQQGQKTPALSSFRIDMEMKIQFPDDMSALFLFNFQYSRGTGGILEAELFTAPPFDPDDDKVNKIIRLQSQYETYLYLKPLLVPLSELQPCLDLKAIGGFEGLPKEIPTGLTRAYLKASKNGIGFSGKLRAKEPPLNPSLPAVWLGEISLDVTFAWDSALATSRFDASFGMSAMISPPPSNLTAPSATLRGSVYLGVTDGVKTWTLGATVDQLSAASLFQFFDVDSQNAVIHLIESIEIKTLDVLYVYSSGVPSSFEIEGIIEIGDLEFVLYFTNDGNAWDFYAEARLKVEQETEITTLGAILQSLTGSTFELPAFVTEISIPISTKKDAGFRVTKTKTGERAAFMTAWVNIFGFTFQYIQYCRFADMDEPVPVYKRLFFVALNTLPEVSLPLVGDITQPFDEALFMWVQPQEGWAGMTEEDLVAINIELASMGGQKPVPYKSSKNPPGPKDVQLATGMHLMLVLKDSAGRSQCVLDYVFGNKANTETQLMLVQPSSVKTNENPPASTNQGSAMAAYQRSVGPLSITNMGFGYTSEGGNTISIKLDASIVLGPVGFKLIGFELLLNFSKSDGSSYTLKDLPKVGARLAGMAASFSRAPVEFAGLFVHIDKPGIESYQGAASLAFAPWLFQAAGYYGEIAAKDSTPAFKSAFAYCILKGPLVTLEFATISGVCGGFGYNSNIKFPNTANVPKFPLITKEQGGDAKESMDKLLATDWFFPQHESFWVGAGLTVRAFEMLDIQAVVVVQWDPQVMLAVFGLCTADIPVGSAQKFAHVQLGLVATVDFAAGLMKIEGQLTPESYILAPECHLTGGFALYSWFDSIDPNLKGDWVFTIGGYHPAFKPPPQYPVPPRLAISWQYDSSVSIRGQAYFAICPKVCMGGGRLDVALSSGPLYAYFDAYMDFLIQFKPFYFTADGGVKVGVQFTLDAWIATVHIAVELSAVLHLEGPPLQGWVYVDFYIFGFTIKFGNQTQSSSAKLSLEEFYDLVLQSDKPSLSSPISAFTGSAAKTLQDASKTLGLTTSDNADESDDSGLAHVFIPQTGLIPANSVASEPSGDEWAVRGAVFSFILSCKFAVTSATVTTEYTNESVTIVGTGLPLYSKPMRVNEATGELKSTLEVKIRYISQASELTNASDNPTWNNNVAITKALPSGLWGEYVASENPTIPGNNTKNLLNGSAAKTVELMTGLDITAPLAKISNDQIAAFDVNYMMVVNVDPQPPFPVFQDADLSWKPQPPLEGRGEQFRLVKETWEDPETQKAGEAVPAEWPKDVFGWTDATLPSGAYPQRLVEDFYTNFLYSPLLSDVAVAA